MATIYIDGSTLNNATACFTDADLTICAPAGFYSDGVTSRQQVVSGGNCYLLPASTCGTCAEPCGESINGSGDQGVYLLDLDTGGTATDVGAIIVTFDPRSIPDGVKAVFNGTVYNKLSSPTYGLLQSTNPGSPTFIGRTSSQSFCSGNTLVGTYPSLNEFNYVGGSTNDFVATGNQQSITIAAGDSQLTANAPGNCVMVIPKPNPSPTIVNLTMIGPCGDTIFDIGVACPVELTGFSSNPNSGLTQIDACDDAAFTTWYHVPVNASSTAGTSINQTDYIFQDKNGQNAVADGWYRANGTTIEVTSGIVTAKGNACAPNYIYLSTVRTSCSDFCTTNYTTVTQKQVESNATYLGITDLDTIDGSILADGFYAYSPVVTDTNTGPFRIMQLQDNRVTGIFICVNNNCVPL
jgi:hypothetical protein